MRRARPRTHAPAPLPSRDALEAIGNNPEDLPGVCVFCRTAPADEGFSSCAPCRERNHNLHDRSNLPACPTFCEPSREKCARCRP